MRTWRERAMPIIRDVLASTAGQPEKAIRAALRAAYPFGMRQYYPYKIWCDEIRRQRGKKRPLSKAAAVVQQENPAQTRLIP